MINLHQADTNFVKRSCASLAPMAAAAVESSMDPAEQRRVLALPRVHEVGRFWSVSRMHEKPLRRLQQIHRWFTDHVIATLLMPLTRQDDRLSLRALDWLVTNYAKKNNIVLADETSRGPPLNVYADYRSMLTFWRRKNFDPFRRHQRLASSGQLGGNIYFYWRPPGTPADAPPVLEETTVGQLNFLHWAELNGIIRYARQHVDEIENDMASRMSQVKARKKQEKLKGIRSKRTELSKAPKNKCYIYKIESKVDLNPETTCE